MLRLKSIFFLLLLLIFRSGSLLAAEEAYFNELRGTNVSPGNVLIVNDEKFYNCTTADCSKWHISDVKNYIGFELNVDTSIFFYKTPFTATLNATIHFYADQTDTSVESSPPQTIDLTIQFDTTKGGVYKGVALYKFQGARKFKVVINSITSARFGTSIPAIFRLTGKTVIQRQYEFADNSTDVSVFQALNDNQLRVSWTPANYPGAEQFDLEWTVIDSLSTFADTIRNSLSSIDATTLDRWFKNNASRITTNTSSYTFNLAYNSGYLLYRIRGVQVHYGDNIRYEGAWNYSAAPTVGGTVQPPVVPIGWHQSTLNWQYTASFAEEGKRKEVVQYFDGSLRNRQAVTLDNTNQVAVVQETIYDAEGRATASVLPAPVNDNKLRYFPAFNQNSSNAPYSFSDLQYGINCQLGATVLSTGSGAAQYYSSNNPFTVLHRNFIPSADGYPIAVTAFTPDNTGRIASQGGVGIDYQLGSGHETKYFYGKPTQTELDRLFGSEAGTASHYLKNMVVDPNGQISVSYVNAGGKTVATALAGKAPDSLNALPASVGASVRVTNDLINNDNLVADAANSSLFASATFTAAVTGDYAFTYNLNPGQLKMYHGAQNQFTLCSSCYYDLKIEVKNNCDSVLTSRVRPAGSVFDPSCTSPQNIIDSFLTPINAIGEYHVTYELVINKNALQYYDSVNLADNTNIRTQSSFLSEELRKMDFSNCFNNCKTCLDDLGTVDEFLNRFRVLYQNESMPLVPDDSTYIVGLYNTSLADCVLRQQSGSCISPCEDKLNIIKADVSPGGQYALYNDSTFQPVAPTAINVLTQYTSVQSFPDEFGMPDSVTLKAVTGEDSVRLPVNQLSVVAFISNWKNSWADSLARFHPEYCYYLWCTSQSQYYGFDVKIKDAVGKASVAMANGYFSTTDYAALLKTDPFFAPANRGGDSSFYKQMQESLRLYSRSMAGYSVADRNILEVVKISLYCKNNASPWEGCLVDDSCRALNREWEMYKQLYFNLKESFYERARLAAPGFANCRNCFVGKDAFTQSQDPPTSTTTITPGSSCPDASAFEVSSTPVAGNEYRLRVIAPRVMTGHVSVKYLVNNNVWADAGIISFVNQSEALSDGTYQDPFIGAEVTSVYCSDSSGGSGNTTTVYNSTDSTYFKSPLNCVNGCPDNMVYNDYDRPGVSYFVKIGTRFTPPTGVPAGYTQGAFYSSFIIATGSGSSCVFNNVWVYIKDQSGVNLPPPAPPSACPADPLAFLYAGKQRRFGAYASNTDLVGQTLSNNPQHQSDQYKMAMNGMFQSSCEARADSWINALSNCVNTGNPTADSLKLDSLRKELIKICAAASSATGVMGGASTAPDTLGLTYTSFEAAIKGILGNSAVNSSCAVELLNDAYPYNRQPVNALTTISETDYDICVKLTQFRTAYQQSGFTGTFYQYMQKTTGTSLVLGETQLHDMERSCASCFNIINEDMPLPVPLMPGRRTYISCDTLQILENAFRAKFPDYASLEPYIFQRLRTNYFNQALGFSLNYYDYKDFLDSSSCNGGSGPSRLYDQAATPIVQPDDNLCVANLFKTAAFNTRLRYTAYIDSVREDFREAYLNRCMAAQAAVKMKADLFEYHYTLYYYDQSNNLVKTIPPAGVQLLNAAQIDSVQLDRLYNKGNCYKYSHDLLFDTSAAKSFPGRWQYSFGINGFSVESYLWLENYNNQALISYYDTATKRGYRLFIYNDSLVFRLQQNDTSFYQVTAGGVEQFIPLQQWTHLVATRDRPVRSLFGKKCSIIVNGTALPLTIQLQFFNQSSSVDPGYFSGTPLLFGADNTDTLPRFKGRMKQLRLYNRALSVQEARQNYTNTCLMPAKQDGLVFWAPVNEGKGQFTDILSNDTSRNVNGSLSWLYNRTGIFPAHTLPTIYEYNSLNQVVRQVTPDAGESRFWYDRLGRLTASQNSEQLAPVNGGSSNRYSYTLYDVLGRITEVGEKTGVDDITTINLLDTTAHKNWLAGGHNYQVTQTLYDAVNTGIITVSSVTSNQWNLRKRVVSTLYKEDGNSTGYNNATHYTYDINGNVKTLWQEIGKLRPYGNDGLKQIDYDYDLVSGKVNRVNYQAGKGDQFIYRYLYDAENRITAAYSSRDGLLWSTDAEYRYYLHGPLARTELGTHKVQGLDYAYTLQGWLKGLNTTNLAGATNITGDMGGDAQNGSRVSKDVVGFALHYNHHDYTGIDATARSFANLPGSGGGPGAGALFNGNIAAMSVNLGGSTQPLLYRYSYDQLNRLVNKNAFSGFDTTNRWTPISLDDYKETLTYDANGNILTNKRNGTTAGSNPLAMDDLTYHYQPNTNKLTYVSDAVAAGNYSNDIDDQQSGNYSYDKIGNLITDNAEGLQNIQWTVYGKIKGITKTGTAIGYEYDAAGNRIYKEIQTGASTNKQVYVRDAQGNTMAVYRLSNDSSIWSEQHLYGSSRLGMYQYSGLTPSEMVTTTTGTPTLADSILIGSNTYELGNHLGNVLAVVNDKKIGVASVTDSSLTDHYAAEVLSSSDYYAFGMLMPGRNNNLSVYRYGFNGKENDNDVKGEGNQQDYGMRIYDSRIGKFLSVDPLTNNYAFYTPYQFAGNKPIVAIDLDGLEELIKSTPVRYRVNQKGSILHGYYPKAYNQDVYSTKLNNPTSDNILTMASFRADADNNDDWSGATAGGTTQSSSAIENRYGNGFNPHKLNLLTLPGNRNGQSNYDAFKDQGVKTGDLYIGINIDKNGKLNGTIVGIVGDYGPNSQPGEQSPMANKNLFGSKEGSGSNRVIYIVFPGTAKYWKLLVGTDEKGKINSIPTNGDLELAYSNFRKEYFANSQGNGSQVQKNNTAKFWKTIDILIGETRRKNYDNATEAERKMGLSMPKNNDRNKN